MAARQMALTPSLVETIHRVVEDPGPDPNVHYHTEDDYDALIRQLLPLTRLTKTFGSLPMDL